MVIHLSAKVLHNNTLGLSHQSKNHCAIVYLSLFRVTLFNKQNVKPTKQVPFFVLLLRKIEHFLSQPYLSL
jgi:hypothetical protein